MLSLLNNSEMLSSKYKLMFEYLSVGDTINAKYCLNNIPVQFALTSTQQNEHQKYQEYLNILLEFEAGERNIYQADSSEIASLYAIVNNSKGKLNSMVKNILANVDTLSYIEPYIFPDNTKESRVRYYYKDIAYDENRLVVLSQSRI